MNASLQKETRLLLPAWGLALAAAVIPACLPNSGPSEIALPCFVVGALLLALAPFGQEISLGTFSLLLSQPQERLRLWRTKVAFAVTAMFSVWAVLAILWMAGTHGSPAGRNLVETCALLALALLAGALWTTLLFRQYIAAFWASLLLPWLLCALWPARWDPDLQMTPARALAVPLLIYAAAGFFFARRLVLQAQDMPWTGGVISLAKLRPGTWSWLAPQTRQRPWLALLRKEIGLQQVTLFLIPCLLALHLLALAVRVINPAFAKTSTPISSVWILWLAGPFVMGSVAVAEERRLNTMTEVLSLPVRRFRQFFLKLAVVIVGGVVLGAVFPWLLEDLGQFFGARNELLNWNGRPSLFMAAGAIAIVSFFASSMSRNSLHALGTGFVLSVMVFLYLCGGGFHFPMNAIYLDNPLLRLVFGPITVAALIWPAYSNFRRIEFHFAWLSSLVVWAATVIVLMAVAAGLYFRPWELALSLEPPHFPVRVKTLRRNASHPRRVCATSTRAYVLLQSGALWESPLLAAQGEPFDGMSGFVGGSWIEIAADFSGALAIQKDGTLWDVSAQRFGRRRNTQVDSDSDWKSLAPGASSLCALKQNGTLWRLNRETLQMDRLEEESRWIKIFGVDGFALVAIQQDGSVWHWVSDNDGNYHKRLLPGFKGTNWISFASNSGRIMGLDDAGTIWEFPTARSAMGWKALDVDWTATARIDSFGRLWTQTTARNRPPRWRLNPWVAGEPWRLSKYSDWVALTVRGPSLIALADDGVISCWRLQDSWEAESSLLAPSRKPEWSFLLFNPSVPPHE